MIKKEALLVIFIGVFILTGFFNEMIFNKIAQNPQKPLPVFESQQSFFQKLIVENMFLIILVIVVLILIIAISFLWFIMN